jgi:hypothetical protein
MGNKGFEAALAAVEMASLKDAISSQPSALSQKQVPRFARDNQGKEKQIPPSRSAKLRNKSKKRRGR